MKRMSAIAAITVALMFAPNALAQTPPPAAATAEPELDQAAADGLRACMSIAQGRSPAEAVAIFGLTPDEAGFSRETQRGKIEFLPPTGERKSCRIHIYALTLDNEALFKTVQDFLTTPPQSFAQLQYRLGEQLGNYASRTSTWAASDGTGLRLVTMYEVLGDNYYLGPKIILDYVVSARGR
jgi:hypothetical protein